MRPAVLNLQASIFGEERVSKPQCRVKEVKQGSLEHLIKSIMQKFDKAGSERETF